jgi:hypothetical protein
VGVESTELISAMTLEGVMTHSPQYEREIVPCMVLLPNLEPLPSGMALDGV